MDQNNDASSCLATTVTVTVTTHEPAHPPTSPSSQASLRTFEMEPSCRICLERGTEPLVSPCKCAGSAKFAHESCLLKWFFKTRRRRCEICLSEVNVKSVGFKPLQKWRLPTDSCDFVFYLFSLYCVIMFVFTGMIIWIATQGCLSPVCITLYVICSMSLVYFVYCCGCVEYSKTYWNACVTTNKNWRIYNREESSRIKSMTTREMTTKSESSTSGKSESQATQCEVPIPSLELTFGDSGGRRYSYPSEDMSSSSISGSTTLIQCCHQTEDTRQIEGMSSPPSSPLCSSLSSFSPVAFNRELACTGSMSLLTDLNCIAGKSICKSLANCKTRKTNIIVNTGDDDGAISDELDDGGKGDIPRSNLERNTFIICELKADGLTNKAFDDTKL